MDRRTFVGTVTAGLLVVPLAAEAQQAQRVPKIGVLTMSVASSMAAFEGFPQTLPETFKSRHRRCDRHREDSDLGDPLCLLRLGGERHDEETGSYRADESTPIHNSITRRMEVQPCYAYTRD